MGIPLTVSYLALVVRIRVEHYLDGLQVVA